MSNLPFANYNLLLIEDNPGDIVLIRDFLSGINPNLNVDIAKTFKAASEILIKNEVSYDSILLDLKLPDKEGENLIREVTRLSRSVPVIVLTGYTDMQFSIKSLGLGISDYIIKDELNAHLLWKSIRFSIERNLASQKLQQSESRYKYLFENNPSSIIIWDLNSKKIVNVNQQAKKMYRYSKEEFKNLRIDDIQPKGSMEFFLNDKQGSAEGDDLTNNSNIHNHKKKDGEYFSAEVRGHFIDYEGKSSILLMINDVTEKIEMQERIIESAIRAEEEERNRIANELHDGIVQQLVACGMFTQNIADKVKGNDKLEKEVERLYDLLQQTTIHTRDISHNLKSAEFESKSLPDLFSQLVKQLSQTGKIGFKLNNHLDFDENFNSLIKTNIYRIIQELSSNIIKHSDATQVVLTAEEVNQKLFITIMDDGSGFDINQKNRKGIGLQNVKGRILRLGGEVHFSKPEKGGFQVDIEIPLKAN